MNLGWQCPVCSTVWAPSVRSCEDCSGGSAGIAVLSTGGRGGGGGYSATNVEVAISELDGLTFREIHARKQQ